MKRKNLTARVLLFRCECVYVMNVLCEFTVFSGHINESTRVPKNVTTFSTITLTTGVRLQ